MNELDKLAEKVCLVIAIEFRLLLRIIVNLLDERLPPAIAPEFNVIVREVFSQTENDALGQVVSRTVDVVGRRVDDLQGMIEISKAIPRRSARVQSAADQ